MNNIVNNTAGQAHPYWYEWFVGLVEVVKLLNPDEEVKKVAFQVASIQGWDDVVVTHSNGKQLFQVKHTREKNNLTFGSLVEVEKKQDALPGVIDDAVTSLLGSLFQGAKKSGLLVDPKNELVLYTNREDGSRWSKRGNGDRRPPLLEFWNWLKKELETKQLAEITVPPVDDEQLDYSAAWMEWISSFKGEEAEATKFLKQLTIRTKEDDRDGLEIRIRESLANAFGISVQQAEPLFDALCRELRIWTTGHSGVTVEVLCDALTIAPAPKEFAPAPPPPSPFFPSRLPVAEQLQTDLLDENEAPVVFLTGEPGSGKTSAVSWLANRRTEDAFQGIIGIRFFCFEPIRPEQPFISPDASRVKPEELWLCLLTQLRRGLKGRLHQLRVPLRNAFLTWMEARDHVLRLSDILGQELGRKFVVSIDGIDHAARAAQVMPEQIAAFFASLPSPDEVQGKQIRLLIAGQPPEYYANEYPTWLTIQNDKVRRIDLPKLEQEDIKCLLKESTTTIGEERISEATRLIDNLSKGNTLSVVFAVAEAELCNSLEELEGRLNERSLGDGLSCYYNSIWNHALKDVKGLSCSLSGVISLARTPVNALQLSRVLSIWEKPVPWWNQVLSDLGPLLTRQGDTHLIRHNDVRVFLASKFNSFPKEDRKSVAAQLVNYFQTGDSDRLTAHLQLFPLLRLADRSVEAASLYNVDWVLEGAALGLDVSYLLGEGKMAVSELSIARSWASIVSVSCALDTLDRVSEYTEHYVKVETWQKQLPPFLPSEANVRPLSHWTKNDFHQLVWDAHELCEGGDIDRARGLLERWLSGLGIDQLVKAVADFKSDAPHINHGDEVHHLDEIATRDFETLGRVSAKLKWPFWGELGKDSPQIENFAFYSFEKGFVDQITTSPNIGPDDELFAQHDVRFFANQELAVRNLAKDGLWNLVAELLESMEVQRESFSDAFRLEASWYALRSGIAMESPWIINADDLSEKMPIIPKHYLGEDINLSQFINTAMAIGWTRPSWDTGDIADLIFGSFEPLDEESVVNAMKLLFRSAAVVGRFDCSFTKSDRESAAALFTPKYIQQLLSALWGDVINRAGYRFKGRIEASALAERLTQICVGLGGDFDDAALEAALPFAIEFVLGPRLNAIWHVVKRHGKLDVLRSWINNYISENGIAWAWSTESARETVSEMVPLARSIGMDDLANYCEERARKLIVGYRSHKEYSFERVYDWFSDAAKNDPAIWSIEGWKLWEICRICQEKDGDNRLESEVLKGISAAAIRDGKTTSWWRLVSTTLPKKCGRNWHWQTSQQFVEGYIEALAQGLAIADDEVLPTWSIALSLSFWFDHGDTLSLLKLREALLRQVSEDRIKNIENAMQSVCPVVLRKEDNEDSDPKPKPSATEGYPKEELSDEDAWWSEVDNFLKNKDGEEYRYFSYASGLLSIARRRARLHGNDVLLEGLNIQLNMHMRWAFGGETLDSISIPELHAQELGATDDVFIELVKVLLETYSVEVTVAALEGLHNYVSQNPALISRLFEELTQEWPQKWLLSAAESWAVLHPDDLAEAQFSIQSLMNSSDLLSRLQAWIVLMQNAHARGTEPPEFPLPDEPELSLSEVDDVEMSLMEIPPTILGSARFANKFSSIRMKIQYCNLFGLHFDRLEGLMAQELANVAVNRDPDLRGRGPHRHADYTYVPAEAEKAFGDTVDSILSSNWCSDVVIAKLSQAVLPNEDAWIQRSRPTSIPTFEDWPAESDYERIEVSNETRRQRMLNAAKFASVDCGWTTFSARVRDFTENADFDVHYWLEEFGDSLLIRKPVVPWCPTGRSFVWWIGTPTPSSVAHFVSGLFAGGHQRLSHSHFEIRPPLEWRDEFGWSPNPRNPLEWEHDGVVVAKYQKVHGVLRSAPHGPKYRQPMIDRWIITSDAYTAVEARYPNLRERETLEVHSFKE